MMKRCQNFLYYPSSNTAYHMLHLRWKSVHDLVYFSCIFFILDTIGWFLIFKLGREQSEQKTIKKDSRCPSHGTCREIERIRFSMILFSIESCPFGKFFKETFTESGRLSLSRSLKYDVKDSAMVLFFIVKFSILRRFLEDPKES
mmetsp:Transcript_5549/g.13518  ORF Transcript_5549/g.13518 Transcript_5549/m.13518 type:complete len:145 (+) Transcript_5549:474-908(+)